MGVRAIAWGGDCQTATFLCFLPICSARDRTRSIHEHLNDVKNQGSDELRTIVFDLVRLRYNTVPRYNRRRAQQLHPHRQKRNGSDTNEARHTERLCRSLIVGADLQRDESKTSTGTREARRLTRNQ